MKALPLMLAGLALGTFSSPETVNFDSAETGRLEANVTIYHTINGRRTEKKRTDVTVAANQWHTLRVEFQGNHLW